MILTPLQASSVLIKTDRRRVASDPCLPLMTGDQILHRELTTLLEDDDYNLATIVNSKFYTIYFVNYLSLHLAESLLTMQFHFLNI